MKKILTTVITCLTASLFSLDPVIILMGPPGSGKGTLSQHLKEQHGYNHISCGDLVRQEIDKRTSIGLEIEQIVKQGDFIAAPIMHSLLGQAVRCCKDAGKPFIIDGFGRKTEDLNYLNELLATLDLKDVAIGVMLDAANGLCQQRILHRQICANCGHVYNTETAPSKVSSRCDMCHGPLKQRMNDVVEIIAKRIFEYRENVEGYQRLTIASYPHISYRTDGSIDSCLQTYSKLAEGALRFEGNARAFVAGFAN